MPFINLFLQKRKMHESRYGAIMVIIAYVLSSFMLIIGSDVFYNINSKAAGMSITTDEEAQEKLNKELPVLKKEPVALLIHSSLLMPYGIVELNRRGLGSFESITKEKDVIAQLPNSTDTNWLLGSGLSTQEYEKLLKRFATLSSDRKSKSIQENATEHAANKKGTVSAKDNKREEIVSLSTEASGSYGVNASDKEIDMLERIVQAEAGGEDIKGKILVVNVIMNRVEDEEFPDTIEDVIFQNKNGDYQFSPIEDERYWKVKVSDNTEEAVKRALKGEDYSKGALYFIARKRTKASSAAWFDNNLKWLFRHGGHEFYK